jgi:hypothetical protein
MVIAFSSPHDKFIRVVGFLWGEDVEFLSMGVNVANEFDVDPVFEYVAGIVGCIGADRNVNLTDRFRFLKKIGFQTERGTSATTYSRNEDEELVWGLGSVTVNSVSGITISPNYPEMTDVPFSDWQYLGVSESADVVLAIREQAGVQDWYKKFAAQTGGTTVRDSEGNPVIAPGTGLPFKTGTSTQHLIIARQFTSGPICTDNNLDPEIEEATLSGTIGEEVEAHSINISWSGFRPTVSEATGEADLPSDRWEAFAYSVSAEQNASTVEILLRPWFG